MATYASSARALVRRKGMLWPLCSSRGGPKRNKRSMPDPNDEQKRRSTDALSKTPAHNEYPQHCTSAAGGFHRTTEGLSMPPRNVSGNARRNDQRMAAG